MTSDDEDGTVLESAFARKCGWERGVFTNDYVEDDQLEQRKLDHKRAVVLIYNLQRQGSATGFYCKYGGM